MEILKRSANFLLGTALVVSLVIIAVWSERLRPGYAFQENMAAAAATTVTALLAVTLFVERAMAVFNAIVFGEEHRDAEAKLLAGNVSQGAEDMKTVLGKKERMRLFGSFIAGAFISAAGVRTLSGLLDVKDPSTNPFFMPVDVVLTAALIAGGSNGLAFLLQVIKDMMAPPDQAEPPNAAMPDAKRVRAEAQAPASVVRPASSRYFRARLTTG